MEVINESSHESSGDEGFDDDSMQGKEMEVST